MSRLRRYQQTGTLGRLLEHSKIPEHYFIGPGKNMFDAVGEGLSFLVLVKEHKETVVRIVEEEGANAGDGVVRELNDLHAYAERVAGEFERLGSCIGELAREVREAAEIHRKAGRQAEHEDADAAATGSDLT